MGRRSINTTKSGKFMNPTDQARKEARKKELKKNKKQRQLVRAAVLKGKDAHQIIEEMEKIDQMEYNVMQPPPLNEKVLKDKRKKLKETLERVLKMYSKDDQEKWSELKQQMIQYERRRIELVSYFEAVRHAQQVQVDEIPLPTSGNDINRAYPGALTSQIPLPEHPYMPHYVPQPFVNIPVPPSILKKSSMYSSVAAPAMAPNRDPPGVPPFPPPDIYISDDEMDDRPKVSLGNKRTIRFADDNKDEERDVEEREHSKKPTSLQQKMLAMAGQDIDQFMKEMERVHKKSETERAQDLNSRLSQLDNDSAQEKDERSRPDISSSMMTNQNSSSQPPMPLMGLPPPPPLMYRPPPPPLHLRMPPPPPPRMGIRLPPGPPPGMPRMLRPGGPMPMPRVLGPHIPMPGMPPPMPNMSSQKNTPNVLSAAPQLNKARGEKDGGKSATTIEAKPQIRNLAADVTRFVPTALRVKKPDERRRTSVQANQLRMQERLPEPLIIPKPIQPTKSKDDAYSQFMEEMQNLL